MIFKYNNKVGSRAFSIWAFFILLFSNLAYADAESEEDVAELEDLTVTDVPDDLSILPSEPSEGAFGLSLSLLETPRSVTEVSSELIKTYALRSVDDLVRLTPGAFTSSFFGIRGSMDIRGEASDNYFRGFRRINNPGAFNTIVRGAHTLEILRGPVSPLYGSGSVGGQLNYSPKTAKSETAKYISEPTGRLDLTLGTYNQRILSGEYGAPFEIGDRQAGLYVFAEIEDSESFYHGYEPSSELVQVAFDMDFSDRTTIEIGIQNQTTDSIQVPGWTRVTQDLVDNGTYITGTPSVRNNPDDPIGADRLTPGESGFITPNAFFGINSSFSGVTTWFVPNDPVDDDDLIFTFNGVNQTVGPLGGFINPITNVGTAQIDHRTTFIDDIDFADTTARTAYLDVVTTFDSGLEWKNQLFYDYLDHTKHQSWGFTALYPGAEVMEIRSSLTFDYETEGMATTMVVGINYRREDMDHREAWYDENFDRRDMLVGPTPDDRIDWAVVDPFKDATLLYDDEGNVTGIEGTVRRNFNGDQKSLMQNNGVFFLADTSFGPLNILWGGRYDQFDAKSEETAVGLLGIPFDSSGLQKGDIDATSYNVSVSYEMDSGLIPYVTQAESSSLSTNQLGGIYPGTIGDRSFVQDSEIFEAGFKYSGFDGALYTAVAYYDQEKTFRDAQTQALVAVYGDGIEAELRWVISDAFSLSATFTNSDTTEISDGALAVINQAQFAAMNGLEVTDLYGGRIAGARATFLGSQVEADRGGLPDTVVSAYGSYSRFINSGKLIASLGFTYADNTYMDITQAVMLPSYSVWTASLSYLSDSYEIMATINNVFDEEYYTSADLFDAVVVKPSEGTTASVIFSYKF